MSPRKKTAPRDAAPHLDEGQLTQLLGLIEGADTVELKLTVPDTERWSTVVALGIDPLDAYMRQVFFFDTPDLALDQAGLVVRARRSQGRDDDSVVKLRPVDPATLGAETRNEQRFGVEVDAMPGGFVCSASFKGTVKRGRVKEAVAGERPLAKLFSKKQRAFYGQHAPDGVGIDDLSILGPVTLLKLKWAPKDYGRKLVAELWFYPDGSRILELSTKCRPDEAFDVAARTRAYLTDKGVDLGAAQQTKTRTALDFFTQEVA